MNVMTQDRIFDTLLDTNKIYVSIKTHFTLRNYINQEGKAPVILSVTGNRKRERIPVEVYVDTTQWNCDKQRLNPTSPHNNDINLILDNIMAKVTAIKTSYRLAERILTPALLRKELLNGMPRVLFTAFFKMALDEEKGMLKPGTYRRHKSVLEKLKAYNSELSFMDFDEEWFNRYRRHLANLGNQKTTISSNIASIKKFLVRAQKSGIKLRVNLDEIKAGRTNGNRTYLSPEEVKRFMEYYFSSYINPSYQLIVGYFLFSCMTGLRISDVQNLTRESLSAGYISFISEKSEKNQVITLNATANRIIDHCSELFVTKFADQHINDELKKICKIVSITKHVTFHVARHTFATNFLRAGGNVQNLQKLLGHSNISDTMIYVHILQEDANNELSLMDILFK